MNFLIQNFLKIIFNTKFIIHRCIPLLGYPLGSLLPTAHTESTTSLSTEIGTACNSIFLFFGNWYGLHDVIDDHTITRILISFFVLFLRLHGKLETSNGGGEKEWYFFCLRGRKYRNSIRPNRVTGSGFWKATGIDRPIYPSSITIACECIGLKKSLVYYRGSAGKGTKTDWMMHEYRLPLDSKKDDSAPPTIQEAEVWTICRIFKRSATYKRDPQNCREATSKKTPIDQYSSSNTSSLEYDGGDQYRIDKRYPNNYVDSEKLVDHPVSSCNYSDEMKETNHGRWMNPTLQNPAPAFHPNGLNPLVNEWNHKDGSWDELGRMMEYMNQSIIHDYR